MLFPIICVDDFYSDPDKVREFALSLDFEKDKKSNYPGKRTRPLHEIDSEFFDSFCNKIFSLFFDIDRDKISWIVHTSFQKIYKYESPEDVLQQLNSGWVHLDSDLVLAGVIYLNPSPNSDSGTSFYKPKDISDENILFEGNAMDQRNDLYHNKKISLEEHLRIKSEHHSKFYKTAEFKNVYNRLITYDTGYWHKESSFLMDSEDFRLTQVFFVSEMKFFNDVRPPVLRSKKYEF